MVAFYDHALSYYRRPDGTPTRELDEFKLVIGHLRRQFGEAAAVEFGRRDPVHRLHCEEARHDPPPV